MRGAIMVGPAGTAFALDAMLTLLAIFGSGAVGLGWVQTWLQLRGSAWPPALRATYLSLLSNVLLIGLLALFLSRPVPLAALVVLAGTAVVIAAEVWLEGRRAAFLRAIGLAIAPLALLALDRSWVWAVFDLGVATGLAVAFWGAGLSAYGWLRGARGAALRGRLRLGLLMVAVLALPVLAKWDLALIGGAAPFGLLLFGAPIVFACSALWFLRWGREPESIPVPLLRGLAMLAPAGALMAPWVLNPAPLSAPGLALVLLWLAGFSAVAWLGLRGSSAVPHAGE